MKRGQKLLWIVPILLFAGSALSLPALLTETEAQHPGEPVSNQTARKSGCTAIPLNPEWAPVVSPQPVLAVGEVRDSHISSSDNFLMHDSHDWNFFLKLEAKYRGLHSDANKKIEGERVIEIEWESLYFPLAFTPIVGDRALVFGRWVFDCGHPPYRTEIHPPQAVALLRRGAAALSKGGAEVSAHQLLFYTYGVGGEYDVGTEHPDFYARDYTVQLSLPPKPSLNARPLVRILSLPYGGPKPRAHFESLPKPSFRITFPLSGYLKTSATPYGAVLAAGWSKEKEQPLHLKVTLEDLVVLNSHDDPPASRAKHPHKNLWHLYLQLGSKWLNVSELANLSDVHDGDRIPIQKSVSVTLFPKEALAFRSHGWEGTSDGIDALFGVRAKGHRPKTGRARFRMTQHLSRAEKICTQKENFCAGEFTLSGNDYRLHFKVVKSKK